VAFSIVTKIALHSYIQYEESYQGQRKLKAKVWYTTDIIKLLHAKWFTVKDTTDEDTLRPTRSMETSDKTQSQYCVCSTKEKWRSTTVCSRCSRDPHGKCFL